MNIDSNSQKNRRVEISNIPYEIGLVADDGSPGVALTDGERLQQVTEVVLDQLVDKKPPVIVDRWKKEYSAKTQ